jgi:HTH-type transcriptional regulator/antitoxin MqsA
MSKCRFALVSSGKKLMNATSIECPVCEQGQLTPETYNDEFQYNGSTVAVRGLERHRCSVCHAKPILRGEIKRNQIRIADAKRVSDGLLTADEIRRVRELVHMSQADAARIFGGGTNAFSKYERGEVAQSVAMDRLLRLIRDIPGAAQLAASYAGITLGSAAPFDKPYVAQRTTIAPFERRPPKAKPVVVRSEGYEAA